MKASEIPVGHLCKIRYLDGYNYGIIVEDLDCYNSRYVFWFAPAVRNVKKCLQDDYEDLGPCPEFEVKEVVKREIFISAK